MHTGCKRTDLLFFSKSFPREDEKTDMQEVLFCGDCSGFVCLLKGSIHQLRQLSLAYTISLSFYPNGFNLGFFVGFMSLHGFMMDAGLLSAPGTIFLETLIITHPLPLPSP